MTSIHSWPADTHKMVKCRLRPTALSSSLLILLQWETPEALAQITQLMRTETGPESGSSDSRVFTLATLPQSFSLPKKTQTERKIKVIWVRSAERSMVRYWQVWEGNYPGRFQPDKHAGKTGRKNGGECLSLGGGRTKRTSVKQAVSTVVPREGSKILASEWCQFKRGYGNKGEPESQSSPILI